MNNHCVPDFKFRMDQEEEYPIPIPSTPKKHTLQNDEIMELLWQNGQVVLQSQNQRQLRKQPPSSSPRNNGMIRETSAAAREIRVQPLEEEEHYRNEHLFMQEDEMTSWLHYSIDEDPAPLNRQDFRAEMFYPPPPNHGGSTADIRPLLPRRPPIPPARRIQNFVHFSKHNNARAETVPPASSKDAAALREPTVVDSCDTPAATATVAAAAVSRSSAERGDTGCRSLSTAGRAPSLDGVRETAACEMTMSSSPGGSSGSAEPVQREPALDRKRKCREPEESEFQGEDVDIESTEAKKQTRGSTSTKRSRAAEVHNLSERRRRDRINEKMRALQELIPRCNKSDKASMLDEAIEYLKSLKLQVQMMSMGCGMLPMMFPGIQQYIPSMGMGIGMGMGMEMGINRPVMPFPNMLAGSALPSANPSGAPHLGPRFPMPPFHMPHVPAPDASRMQVPNLLDNHNVPTSTGTSDPADQSRVPNFIDSNQQYLGPHQINLHLMQAMNQSNATKPSSRGQENPEKHQPEET